MIKKIMIIFGLFLILSSYVSVAMAYETPGRTKYFVNDYAGVIDNKIKDELEKELTALKHDKGIELIISTFLSLNGSNFEGFVAKYTHKWRRPPLFENDKRMHIILAFAEKKVTIGTGRGLEKVMATGTANSILNNEIMPKFTKGQYGEGMKAGVDSIIKVFNESKIPLNNLPINSANTSIFLFIIAAILFIIFYRGNPKGSA